MPRKRPTHLGGLLGVLPAQAVYAHEERLDPWVRLEEKDTISTRCLAHTQGEMQRQPGDPDEPRDLQDQRVPRCRQQARGTHLLAARGCGVRAVCLAAGGTLWATGPFLSGGTQASKGKGPKGKPSPEETLHQGGSAGEPPISQSFKKQT